MHTKFEVNPSIYGSIRTFCNIVCSILVFERVAIRFYCKAGFTVAKMWEIFVKAFGDSSASCAAVFRWHSQFAAEEESFENTEWSGRLGATKINKNVARVAAALKDNRCASCRMKAESMGVPKTIVHCILSDDLEKQKLCAQFVPHALTAVQWEQCVVHAKDLAINRTLLI